MVELNLNDAIVQSDAPLVTTEGRQITFYFQFQSLSLD